MKFLSHNKQCNHDIHCIQTRASHPLRLLTRIYLHQKIPQKKMKMQHTHGVNRWETSLARFPAQRSMEERKAIGWSATVICSVEIRSPNKRNLQRSEIYHKIEEHLDTVLVRNAKKTVFLLRLTLLWPPIMTMLFWIVQCIFRSPPDQLLVPFCLFRVNVQKAKKMR